MRGLQDYRVLRLLGEGGDGRCFLALDLRLMRRVVIKVRRQEDSRSVRRRFHAEARRVAQLEGRRVVQVLDAVASGPEAALVLRYVPGCNLDELLAWAGQLSPSVALAILTDLAEGLAAARQQLLVHGDLKGSNILLGTDGRAAITDFGIAVGTGQAPRGASPQAWTPEHVNGEVLTQQSDFFALGLLFYRMLCGRHPFQAGGQVLSQRICGDRGRDLPLPETLPDVAREPIRNLLHDLLRAQPADRPPSTLRLRNTLRDVRSCLPSARRLPDLVAPARREDGADATAPPLPERLLRLPRGERWMAATRTTWNRATYGARSAVVAGSVAACTAGVLYAQRPGDCVLIDPTVLDLSPLAALQLPAAGTLEARILHNLRRWPVPVLPIGAVEGSDSEMIIRPQGVRDVCTAERRIRLTLRCWGEECELELESTAPGVARHGEMVLPSTASLENFQQSIDQLLAPQLAALLPPR